MFWQHLTFVLYVIDEYTQFQKGDPIKDECLHKMNYKQSNVSEKMADREDSVLSKLKLCDVLPYLYKGFG